MDTLFIVSQIFGFLGWLFYFASYYAKRENKILVLQIICVIFYTLNYGMIKAYAAVFISLFELFKLIGYYKTDYEKEILYFTLPVYLIIAFCFKFNYLTLIMILSSVVSSFANIGKRKVMLIGGMLSTFIAMIYDIAFDDYVIVISDVILILSNLFILLKGFNNYLFNRNNVHTRITYNLSDKLLKELYDIDRDYYEKEYQYSMDNLKALNPYTIYVVIKDKGKLIGYMSLLSLKDDTYEQILKSNDIIDKFNLNNINKNDHIKNLLIHSIVIENDYLNKDTFEKIKLAFNNLIYTNSNISGTNIISYGVTDCEINILNLLNLVPYKKIDNKIILYKNK